MNAHDVRHLRCCMWCGELGDDRHMIRGNEGHSHGRCFVLKFGADKLLELPRTETDKLTLGDIGKQTMMVLLDTNNGAGGGNAATKCRELNRANAAVQPIPREPTPEMLAASPISFYGGKWEPDVMCRIWIAMHDAFTKSNA